ncbi:MAG: DUF5808 domain-containing protein [Candidatus Acidiferrales bacterium]
MIEHFGWWIVVPVCATLLLAWLFWMLPEWTRPGIYFAVTTPPEFRQTPGGQQILRRYQVQVTVHLAVAVVLIVAGMAPQWWPALIVGIVWLAFGPLVALLMARERVRPHAVKPSMVREAVLAPRAAHLPGGWLLQLGPFAVLAATAIYLQLHWNEIPDRFPVHWGIDGQPNGWSVRTPAGVYGPLLFGASIIVGLAVLTYGTLRHTRVQRARGSGSLHVDFPHQVAYFLVAVEFFLAGCMSAAALLPLTGNPGIVLVLVLVILLLAGIFPLAHWMNKSRAPFADAHALNLVGDGTLDEHWKMGVLYFNPADPALFVEKRFGIGYTLNFGHASSWLIIALVLVLPLALLLTLHHS